jgi:two-component system, OmpR family, sensor histidine kinase SenX3
MTTLTAENEKLDISTFLLASVHDMKNSLGMIASHLEGALAEATEMEPNARKKTAQALYETQRVNDHLIQLLALYKIEQTFYPFDPQEQSIADLAREALARAQPLADSKNIQLECECAEDLFGWLDYDLVFGVVMQALHNALHYTQHHVLLSSAVQGTGVVIRIEDDGPGYPDFLLDHGDGARRGINFETGSTGLGLYFAGIVARLHQAGPHTGRIYLENGGRFGGGCFVLELP